MEVGNNRVLAMGDTVNPYRVEGLPRPYGKTKGLDLRTLGQPLIRPNLSLNDHLSIGRHKKIRGLSLYHLHRTLAQTPGHIILAHTGRENRPRRHGDSRVSAQNDGHGHGVAPG